ncbi:MAG TPA: TolC family protein, partial [Hyphomicrobiaceae bacterium]|nr:TolC family protein [Hyphomicrobiaceae bacterium]
YRQTLLTAFQQVEDQLSNLRILGQQQRVQDEAVSLARQAVEITLNEYRAGTADFTTVVTAQATLLTNEQASLTVRQNRFLASVNLIQALGGGWDVSELPGYEELRHHRSCVDVRGAIRGNISPELPACL